LNFKLIFLSLLLVLSSPLSVQAQESFRDAYLPLKIEMFYAYTMNFSVTVPSVGIPGSAWRTTQGNQYLSFECAETRGTFSVLFEIRYPSPIEQILTVKFSEGTRPVVVEYVHYTNNAVDPKATSREPPSAYIRRRYLIRTLPEPTDPNEIVRLLNVKQEKNWNDFKTSVMDKLDEVLGGILLGNQLYIISIVAVVIGLVSVAFIAGRKSVRRY